MFKIDWHQLEKNSEAREVSFESFNYQIAVKKYSSYGTFEYYYNTPGSEFYLTLSKDCAELSAKASDVIGWQAKFWLNRSAPDNSPLDSKHRAELLDGFKKSLAYKSALKTWIICTPGRFINTAPSYPVNDLENGLKSIKPDINITYWYKEQFESIFHSAPEQYASIFNYYFSIQYLSFQLFSDYSGKRLDILRKKYDTDLYTPGKNDKEILSSIFYKNLFDKVNDKIKHTMEYGEKVSENRLFREVTDNFVASSEINNGSGDTKESIGKIKVLIDELLSLFRQLCIYKAQENTLQFTKELFNIIERQRKKIDALLYEAGLHDRPDYQVDISFEPDIRDLYHLRDHLYSLAWNLFDRTKKIYRLLYHASSQVFNILGEASFGKTNFACAVTEHLLSLKLPVLLIPASEIRGNGESIEKQMMNFLGIDGSLSFKDFIGMLDTAGSLYGIKIPIIIDGLNETQPSAAVWNPQLQYIVQRIQAFNNVMLITTCRPSYIKQVFDEDNIDDIPYSIIMEGFKENLEEAIEKYFEKYNIVPKNKDFDKNLFKNPLLLKIFSIANEGKTTEINESNIYVAVESYVSQIIEKISTKDKQKDPLLQTRVIEGIARYSKYLWDKYSRGLPYREGLGMLPLFDPTYTEGDWTKTISYKILDEGLLFRNMHSGEEYAEFTHDLIGGYCIARNVIFDGKTPEQIVSALESDDLSRNLSSEDTANRHPLAEDILKSIVFLCPRYTGKELFELLDNKEVIRASLSVIRIIVSREDGCNSFLRHFTTISPNSPIIAPLLESVLLEILKKGEYRLTEIPKVILLKMSPNQIDLNWSESIRRNADEIISYLYREMKFVQANSEGGINTFQQLLFISLLLSSTNRYLRDKATKALVVIGKKHPATLFDVLLSLEEIADFYIVERMIAAICGVFLQVSDRDLLIRVCGYLEDNYFKRLKTSHVLILDYINTLLDYAAIQYGYKRSALRPPENQLPEWQKDTECIKEVTDDGKATWGFGPVDYDFAKYKIGTYLSSRRFEKELMLPTIKDSLAMVVWKAKEIGYSEDLFEQLDIQIIKERYEKSSSPRMIQPYSKKYSKIAFYELYGHNIIKGLSRDFKEGAGFRVPVTDIDPTFPGKPHKRQLITCCFLPRKSSDIQEWINDDRTGLFEDHYIWTDIDNLGTEWAMLYGHLVQESSNKSRIHISVYTIVSPNGKSDSVIEGLNKDELFMPHLLAENHYVIAGEIPWSKNYLDAFRNEEINGEETELYLPVSLYSRESKTALNIINYVPVLSKRISQSIGLKINLNDFNLYTASNELASTYVHDDYSRFLYIRADLVKKYLEETGLSLIWLEIVSKYGAFGDHDPKYDPSFKDNRIVKKYTYQKEKDKTC